MIVTCESCGARYKLADSKLSGRGAKITCPKCTHVFVVYKPSGDGGSVGQTGASSVGRSGSDGPVGSAGRPGVVSGSHGGRGAVAATAPLSAQAEPDDVSVSPVSDDPSTPPRDKAPSPASERGPVQSAQTDVDTVDFRKVGIDSWKVKKASIGLVYDYHDYRALRRSLRENRINGKDQLSHDGASWVSIDEIDDLAAHMLMIYNGLAAGANPLTADMAEGGAGRSAESTGPVSVPPGGKPGAAGAGDLKAAMDSMSSGAPNAPQRRFADPFSGMRDKQRERAGAAAGPAALTQQIEHREPRKVVRVLVVLVSFVGVFGVAAWYLDSRTRDSITTVDGAETVSRQAPEWGRRKAEELRQSVNEDLRVMEQANDESEDGFGEDDPDRLIPIVPPEFRGGVAARPTSVGGGGAAITTGAATARDHYEVGRDSQRRSAWSSAAAAYGEAARLEPSNAAYQEAYGIALYKVSQLDPASRALTVAAGAGSQTADKWLGHIARDQGDVSGAVGHYQTYLKTNPADASAIQQEVDGLTR